VSHKVYDYLVLALNSTELTENMYKTGFQTIAEWIIKTDTFLSHEELLSLVFKASKTKWFPEVKNIL